MAWKIRTKTPGPHGRYAYYVRMCMGNNRPQLVSESAAFKDPATPELYKIKTYIDQNSAQLVIDSIPYPYNTILEPVEE